MGIKVLCFFTKTILLFWLDKKGYRVNILVYGEMIRGCVIYDIMFPLFEFYMLVKWAKNSSVFCHFSSSYFDH